MISENESVLVTDFGDKSFVTKHNGDITLTPLRAGRITVIMP